MFEIFEIYVFLIVGSTFTDGGVGRCNTVEEYKEAMRACIKDEGKLAHYVYFTCHYPHDRQICEKEGGGGLVFDPECNIAKCTDYSCKPGEECIDRCTGQGEVLHVDYQGRKQCVCNYRLNLFSHNSVCYQEGSQGLCEKGKVMVTTKESVGYKCIDSPCPPGEKFWTDGRCYKVKDKQCDEDYHFLPQNKTYLECVSPWDIRVIDNCNKNNRNQCDIFGSIRDQTLPKDILRIYFRSGNHDEEDYEI